jgi:hypothetical protein
MPSPYDDRDLYDPMGVPLPTEERIRRLMEKQRQAELAGIPTMLSDELPSADMLGADVSSFGLSAVPSPFDGGVSYRPMPRKPPVPYVGQRQGRG